MDEPLIRSALPSDEAAWVKLWQGYCAEVRASGDGQVARRTWTRILDPDSAIMCLIAEVGGRACGFAHCVVHEDTKAMQAVCCVQDLYVMPSERGGGIASALIEWLCNAMRAEGWACVYWLTDEDNEPARRLSSRFAVGERKSLSVIRPR